jgi:hypothetical protein
MGCGSVLENYQMLILNQFIQSIVRLPELGTEELSQVEVTIA